MKTQIKTDDYRNIWIFGGTGFIGKALLKKLSGDPKNRIHLLIHKNTPFKALESLNTFTGDLKNFDFSWFLKYPPDIIFHLARLGGMNYITRYLSSLQGARANQRLVDYHSSMKKKPVVIYVSGSLMYGPQPEGRIADEYSDLAPVSYAKHYVRGERPFLEAQYSQKADIRFARPGWIVGTGSWFSTFYWLPYLNTGKVPQYGRGDQQMSVIDLEDCASQIIDLAKNGKTNQNLNIFSGTPITQKKFAETLAYLLGTSVQPVSSVQLHQQYGRITAEAFNSSIPLKTLYPEIIDRNKQEFLNLEAVLNHNVSLLKNK